MHTGGSLASDSVQHLVSPDGYQALNNNFTNNVMDGGNCGCKTKNGGKRKPKQVLKKKKGGSPMIDTTSQEMQYPPTTPPARVPVMSDIDITQTMEGGKPKRKQSKYPPGAKNKGKYIPKAKKGGAPHISELSDEDNYSLTNQKGGATSSEVIQLNYNDIPLSDSLNGEFQSREMSPTTLESLTTADVGIPFSKSANYGSVADTASTGELMPFTYATGGAKSNKPTITFILKSIPTDQAKALKAFLKLSGATKIRISSDTVTAEFSKSKNLTNAVKTYITPLQKLFANTNLRSKF